MNNYLECVEGSEFSEET